jgi:glutamyl-tRNA reductase
MLLSVTGLSHKTAPVEIREKFAISDRAVADVLRRLVQGYGADEAVLLSTCNRVEIYTVQSQGADVSDFFGELSGMNRCSYQDYLYRFVGDQAVRHIFRVASSVDSMIVGEPQILGQVKEAFHKATDCGTTGLIFHKLFSRALAVGKKVRTETNIGKSAVSVPYAAVELAKKIFGTLAAKNVVVVGSGEMSETTAKHLTCAGAQNLFVVNRTHERAVAMASQLGGIPVKFDTTLEFLINSDIVITSTSSPHFLVRKSALESIMQKRRNRLLFLIDIAVPRDIDPEVNSIENVYLYNIDDLEHIVEKNLKERQSELEEVEQIVEGQVAKFLHWTASREVVPTVRAFRAYLDDIRRLEIERSVKNSHGFSSEQLRQIDYFSKALINKICHLPTAKLKQHARTGTGFSYCALLREMFELDTDGIPPVDSADETAHDPPVSPSTNDDAKG